MSDKFIRPIVEPETMKPGIFVDLEAVQDAAAAGDEPQVLFELMVELAQRFGQPKIPISIGVRDDVTGLEYHRAVDKAE